MRTLPYDLSKIARLASVMLLVYCAAELIFTWHSFILFGFYDAIESGTLSDAEMNAEIAWVDGTGALIGIGFILVLIVCYIVNGMWIYRAASNAQAIHPDDTAITPGWSVGWYFVPFANLVMPFRAMNQTRNRLNGRDASAEPATGLMWCWWLTWLLGNSIATFGFRLNMDAQTIDDFRTATSFDVASSVASMIAALLFRKLIKDMTAAGETAQPMTSQTPNPEEGQP